MNLSRIFSNTDYLGAGEHPEFPVYLSEGIKKYGVHFAGSRLSNTCPEIYDQMEDFIAKKFGAKASVLGSSASFLGALVTVFCKTRDAVFCQSDIHPALQINMPGVIYFEDMDELAGKIKNCRHQEVAVLANSINPITLKVFESEKIKLLATTKKIHLIIDDSHGIGITGALGKGIFEMNGELPENISLSVLASLGKAYSIPGGVIFGDPELIDFVRLLPQWGGSSPMPPAYSYAFLKMQTNYQLNLLTLKENIRYFKENIDRKLVYCVPDFPVFVLKPPKMYDFLEQFGFIISSFGYPSPDNPRVERIVINSAKKKIDILQLAEFVNLKTSLS